MSFLQFMVSMVIPLAVIVYTFNFTLWLWRRRDYLAAVGAGSLTALAGTGAVTYLVVKLFFNS